MAREINREDAPTRAERTLELSRKGTRRGRIAVDEHQRPTAAGRFMNGDPAARPRKHRRLHHATDILQDAARPTQSCGFLGFFASPDRRRYAFPFVMTGPPLYCRYSRDHIRPRNARRCKLR